MTRDELTQKLSIDGVINATEYNLSAIKNYEESVLKFSKEEQLSDISKTDAAYFLRILHTDITKESSNIKEVYTFDVVDEEYTEEVWAASGESIDDEYIIDKAENYDDFNRLSVADVSYYSFRLKNEENGELYAPLFFFVDSSSLVITAAEDILKKILTNVNNKTYWAKENAKLFNSLTIENFSLYRERGEGIIKAIDFDNSLKFIQSYNHSLTLNSAGEVALAVQLSGENSEQTEKIREKLEELKLDVIDKVSRVKNKDMDAFCQSILISAKENTITVSVTVSTAILNLLRFNLISSFTDLLEVFPDIHFDYGEREPLEITDYLAESVVEYKDKYQYRSDFEDLADDNAMYGTARLETRVEISKIEYIEAGENLAITLRLTPFANKHLNWQYKYLEFGIKHVSSTSGNINFSEDFGIDKLPANKVVGDNGVVEQTIVFPKDIKHSDIGEIVTLFTFLEPQEVKKVTITKDDLNKTIELGSGRFTLIDFKNSFVYNYTDTRDSLLEVRGLNGKGEALQQSGGGTSWVKYPNGLKAWRMSPAIEGNIESIELYYVSQFASSKFDMPHPVASNFSDIKAKKDSNNAPFEIAPYKFDTPSPLPIDDFFESDIAKWSKADAGPFEVYLAGVSDNWELEIQLYLKSPNHPAFKNSLSGFEIIIDEVTTNSGDVIKRPDTETLKQWEKDNNTFKRTFSWSFTGPFSDRGDCTVLRSGLSLGITSNYGGLKTLAGHVLFTIPESVTKINIDKLLVGDTLEDQNLEFMVLKYDAGKYHLKLTKGQKNLVQIRAIDPDNDKYKVLESDILDDILTVDAVSMHEEYEFTVSNKNITKEYNFNLAPL